jgi:hypothetical protein
MANFYRYRKAIAETESTITTIEQIWTEKLKYHSQNLEITINIIKLIRHYEYEHLRNFINEDWTKYAYIHPKYGRINLEKSIRKSIEHMDFHRKLVDRNINQWNERNK